MSLVNCVTTSDGDDEFCYCNTCLENEGDCDYHDECKDDLVCGINNCPASLGFDSEVDCCYQLPVGDFWNFCASGMPCGENEGDCDSQDECQDGLFCGYNNCPAYLKFHPDVDCCSNTQIVSPNYPNYPKQNTEETWLLTAPEGSIITLQFHEFHVSLRQQSSGKSAH